MTATDPIEQIRSDYLARYGTPVAERIEMGRVRDFLRRMVSVEAKQGSRGQMYLTRAVISRWLLSLKGADSLVRISASYRGLDLEGDVIAAGMS